MRLVYVLDCADADALADFWAAALRFRRDEFHPPYVRLTDPSGRWPNLLLQQVPEPKTLKNRWHFDLKVGGGRDVPPALRRERVDAAVKRLVDAGATVLKIKDEPDAGFYAEALQDPEGNEFDVV